MRPFMIVVASCLIGCSAEYWTGKTTMRTEIRIDPTRKEIAFVDTKDNNLEVTDFHAKFKESEVQWASLRLTNNASVPIQAEIERIRAIGEAQLSQVQYVTALLAGVKQIVDSVVPLLGQVSQMVGLLREATSRNLSVETPMGSLRLDQSRTPSTMPSTMEGSPHP